VKGAAPAAGEAAAEGENAPEAAVEG
jgi:hypothetical protein